MNRKNSFVLLISIVVIVLVYSLWGGGGKTALDIGEHELSIGTDEFEMSLRYEDILSIETLEVEDFGMPLTGGEDRDHRWGSWENHVWGQYSQHTITGTDKALLIRLHDGNELLLSYESEETTQLLGQVLFDMLAEQGYHVDYIA